MNLMEALTNILRVPGIGTFLVIIVLFLLCGGGGHLLGQCLKALLRR